MAIVNEIKCARCDRKYSGVRSRCPYCGARRIGRGKYSENSDNAKGKMLISVLIMAAFTVAAGVLLFTTPVEASEPEEPPEDDPSISDNILDEIDRQPGIYAPPPTVIDDPEPTPEPEPELVVTSVQIRYGTGLAGAPHDPRELTQPLGRPIEFNARIEPPGLEGEVEIFWESTNPDIFEAIPVVGAGGVIEGGVRVTGLARGNAHLVLRVGDREDRVLIRIS